MKKNVKLSEKQLNPTAISGGNTVESSAKIFVEILKGKGTQAQNAVVIANSAMAIHTAFPNKTREDCREIAIESLRSGKANQVFNTLLTL